MAAIKQSGTRTIESFCKLTRYRSGCRQDPHLLRGARGPRKPSKTVRGERLASVIFCEIAPDNRPEIEALERDRGVHLAYVRAIGRRRADAVLDEPISSLPTTYARHPLLRET
jgi:hypothetical protein